MRFPFAAVWLILWVSLAGPAFGQQGGAERVGAQREVQAISVSLKTGWRGKKEINETYGPPPGFAIVEHRIALKKKDGNANYSVSILPDKFTGITAEEVNSTYSRLAEAAAKLHLVDYQAKLKLEQQDLLKRFELKSVSSGVIMVKASIDGSGELEFVVYAKIANAATNVSLNQIHRLHMENIERLAANPKLKELKDVLCAEAVWQGGTSAICEAPEESNLRTRPPSLRHSVAAGNPAFPAIQAPPHATFDKKEGYHPAAAAKMPASYPAMQDPPRAASLKKEWDRPAAVQKGLDSSKLEKPRPQ